MGCRRLEVCPVPARPMPCDMARVDMQGHDMVAIVALKRRKEDKND